GENLCILPLGPPDGKAAPLPALLVRLVTRGSCGLTPMNFCILPLGPPLTANAPAGLDFEVLEGAMTISYLAFLNFMNCFLSDFSSAFEPSFEPPLRSLSNFDFSNAFIDFLAISLDPAPDWEVYLVWPPASSQPDWSAVPAAHQVVHQGVRPVPQGRLREARRQAR